MSKRSFTGGAAQPHQPRTALVETAEHLRLVAGRFLRATAAGQDVVEACSMFEREYAKAVRERVE